MGILIDELEAQGNDYILALDLINLIADATNSTTDEVFSYLNMHNFDENIAAYHRVGSYNFEPYDDYSLGLHNEAHIAHFKKSDLMTFEPITKHGLFVNNTMPTRLIHDVYGRTYDINQHKKNREDEYLTLSETLDFLNFSTDINASSYDHVKLRDLARKKVITPCFYFDGYAGSFGGDGAGDLYTEPVTGYFTYKSLKEEICSHDDYMNLPNAGVTIYRILEKKTAEYIDYDDVFLFYDRPQDLDDAEKLNLTHIETDEIRFSKKALEHYIRSHAPTTINQSEQPTKDSDDLAKQIEILKAENSNLNSMLSTARNSCKQYRSEITELTKQLDNQTDTPAEVKPLKGIAKHNYDKALFINTGKALARYIWSMDATQAIRTGDMVQQLKHVMHSIDPNLLPDDKAIREWLSGITPDYAKKGGKTPKNAPDEISLIMKK